MTATIFYWHGLKKFYIKNKTEADITTRSKNFIRMQLSYSFLSGTLTLQFKCFRYLLLPLQLTSCLKSFLVFLAILLFTTGLDFLLDIFICTCLDWWVLQLCYIKRLRWCNFWNIISDEVFPWAMPTRIVRFDADWYYKLYLRVLFLNM